MTRKILALAMVLMIVAMLATPVMAAPATKFDVTATFSITTSSVAHQVDHNIMQLKEGTAEGVVTINIPGQDPLVGTYSGDWLGTIKFDHPAPGPFPGAEGHYMGQMIWTFTGEGTTGTFEGTRHTKSVGLPANTYVETSTVLHGTGDFLGQTLKLSYEGAPPIVLEGYLLIPN